MDNEGTRCGTFSSSNIWKLMTNDRSGKFFGAPGQKYIRQVNFERAMERPINPDRDSRPTTWGTFVETLVFDKLPLSYQLVSKKRLFHKAMPNVWSGAPDLIEIESETVSDCKCPFSLEVFGSKLKALKDLETYKDEFEEDYWQHISNAELLESNGIPIKNFEAVVYVPYKSELDSIRQAAQAYTGEDAYRFKWIQFAYDDELPWIPDGGNYKNLNIVRHPVSFLDKQALSARVVLASLSLESRTESKLIEV